MLLALLAVAGCNLKREVKKNWMETNLDVSHYRNGDTILEARSNEEWDNCKRKGVGCWCYLFNDSANRRKYGKLYNWYAVHDSRGLAPEGYHVPTKGEWEQLVASLGGEPVAGKKMKNLSGWFTAARCTNEAGFGGLPGGGRLQEVEASWSNDGFWWAATAADTGKAWVMKLSDNEDSAPIFKMDKSYGFSVRVMIND